MANTTYTIDFSAPPARIERDCGRIIAALQKVDAQVNRTTASMVRMAGTTAVFGKLVGAFTRLSSEAGAAEKAVAGVGKGGNATAAATRMAKLEERLKAATAAAAAAAAAVASVGQGGGGGGGGRGGGGGGGGGKGDADGVGAGLIGGVLKRTAAYAGYRALRKLGGAVGESIGERREFYRGATKVTTDYEKDLKELAVLQGKSSVDDDLIRSDLAFQKKTLLDPDKSSTYRLEFGGAISPALNARGKDGQANITKAVASELEVNAAQLTARYGLDPTTGGRMAGLLGVTHKVPTAQAGMQTMAKALELLNVEGVGPVSGMATQMMALSGSMVEEGGGGRFANYPELAARLAASTVAESGSAPRAARRIEQSSRLLRKFNEKGKGEFEGHGEAEFLAKAGVTEADDYESAIRKVEPLLRDAKGGLGSADTTLASYGFGNSTERKALIQEIGMNRIVTASLANPDLDAKAARAGEMNREFRASGPGQRQLAEIEDFSATVEAGMAGRSLETARMNTRTAMTKEDTLKAGPLGKLLDYTYSATTLGGISGEDMRVDQRMIGDLAAEGEKYGVDVLGKFKGLDVGPRMMGMQDEAALAKNFSSAKGEVDAARKKFAQKLREAANAADAIPADGQGGNQAGAGFGPARR